jgi:hypothetical protein
LNPYDPTHHSTGSARIAAQADEFKRWATQGTSIPSRYPLRADQNDIIGGQ